MQCANESCPLRGKPGWQSESHFHLTTCPGCKLSVYCSEQCQKRDWVERHHIVCQSKRRIAEESFSESSKRSNKKSIDDFEIINENQTPIELGRGSYGSVRLVREKASGLTYALKVMNKKNIHEYSSAENVKREVKIQKKINHPHIIRLIHCFEDKDNVYLVLEYAKNGNLFQLLRRKKKINEQEAFVYFFQTCLGIDYLHKMNIIHRDIKPENLLLDDKNNIKLCDFGWSAESNTQYHKRTTFCGTIDYMPPEMIQNQPHDYSLDVWCLGILLYEMLQDNVPFRGQNDMAKCSSIVNSNELVFERGISPEAKDLITRILKKNPTERPSMTEIFNHQWLRINEKHFNISIWDFVWKDERRSGSTRGTFTKYNGEQNSEDMQNSNGPRLKPAKTMPEDVEKVGVSPSSYQVSAIAPEPVKPVWASEYNERAFSQPPKTIDSWLGKDYNNPFGHRQEAQKDNWKSASQYNGGAYSNYGQSISCKPLVPSNGYEIVTPANARKTKYSSLDESARSTLMGKVSVNRCLDEMKLGDDPEISILNRMEKMLSKKTSLSPVLPKESPTDYGRLAGAKPYEDVKWQSSGHLPFQPSSYYSAHVQTEVGYNEKKLDRTLSFGGRSELSFQEDRTASFLRENSFAADSFLRDHERHNSNYGEFRVSPQTSKAGPERYQPPARHQRTETEVPKGRVESTREGMNQTVRQAKSHGIYFNEKARMIPEDEERVSRVSQRNQPEIRRRELERGASKEESFFQRLLINLGCANRDKAEA